MSDIPHDSDLTPAVPDRKNHPIWAVYDEWKTARLNVKCLKAEIKKLARQNTFIETIIAVSAASSVGGFWFLQNTIGLYAWKTLGAAAVLLAALKPVFPLGERRIRKERLLVSYQTLEHDLYCISLGVQERQAYDEQARNDFHSALVRKQELMVQPDGATASRKLIKKFQAEVNSELPVEKFYIP